MRRSRTNPPQLNPERLRAVGAFLLVLLVVGLVVGAAAWFRNLNDALNLYDDSVPSRPSAAVVAGHAVATQPDVAHVDVVPEEVDGRPGDRVGLTLRPGTPPDRIRAIVRDAADRLRAGGVTGHLTVLVPQAGPGPGGDPRPVHLTTALPAPAPPALDDAVGLWLDQAARYGEAHVSLTGGPVLEATLWLPGGSSTAAVVETFGQLGGARPAGSAPVRWTLRSTDGGRVTTVASDLDVPPPPVLGAMRSVPTPPSGAGDVELRWVRTAGAPEHMLVVVEVPTPPSGPDQQHVQDLSRTYRAALEGSAVPFVVRVAAPDGAALLEVDHR